MPLSFRRSYKKLPSADLDRNKRRIASTPEKKPELRVRGEFRAARYPAILPIGCGIVLVLTTLVLLGQMPHSWQSFLRPRPTQTGATLTSTSEALATSPASPIPSTSMAQIETPAPSPTSLPHPTIAAVPANPWAADVPDAACIPADIPQTGRVVEVLDGDTVRVLLDGDGRVYSVRYLGVDAPGLTGAMAGLGLEALARNTELVYRKQATIVRDLTDSDANGTLLRYVLVDEIFVNHALIQAGLAQVVMTAPDTACLDVLRTAEQQAQGQTLGLWASGIASPSAP